MVPELIVWRTRRRAGRNKARAFALLLSAPIRPWIRPAIVGIISAGEPDLVAVIDCWSTREGKLDQGRKLNATLTLGEIGDIEFLVGSCIGPRREDPQQPS